jgi:hypothetical protein
VKRAKKLYPLIAASDNLYEAFRKAARGRRDTPAAAAAFRADFDANIRRLRAQLLNKEFDLGNYHFFEIRDPKVRTICASSFPERVLHHAVINVCGHVFDSYLIHDTYACRKNKGNLKALERAQEFCRKNAWYLKLDIRRYFDSIDHSVAVRLLKRRFGDADLLFLFERIIQSHHTQPGKGVPVGNLFSQYLANHYLGYFDHWIKEQRKIRHYIRYMDDFLLFSNDKKALKQECNATADFLWKELRLTLKANIQLNRTERGIPFLGFRVFPAHIRLLPEGKKRFSARYREYERRYCDGTWSARELARRFDGLYAYARYSDCLPFRRYCTEHFGVLS